MKVEGPTGAYPRKDKSVHANGLEKQAMNLAPDVVSRTAIEFRSVSRVYGSGSESVVALDDLTVEFPSGSWTVVMGPSGSGKSTLLHCAGGLENVTNGQVLVDGQDITDASERELTELRRTKVGFVFQNFNLIGSLTAEQNVAMPLKLAGRRPSRNEVHAVLTQVGLSDRLRHKPRELSGGPDSTWMKLGYEHVGDVKVAHIILYLLPCVFSRWRGIRLGSGLRRRIGEAS